MAKIGARYCYHNGHSCGHIQDVNVSFEFKEFGRLKKNRKTIDTASVSLTSIGDHNSSIFEVSGPLRWCSTEITEQDKINIFCNTLPNVTLHRPSSEDYSSETDSVEVILETIEGESWSCPDGIIKTGPMESYSDAEYFCINGFLPSSEVNNNA